MKMLLITVLALSSCAGFSANGFTVVSGQTHSTSSVSLHKGDRTLVVTADTDFTGTLAYSGGVKTLSISKYANKVHGTFTFPSKLTEDEIATVSVTLTNPQKESTTFSVGLINYDAPILSVRASSNGQLALSTQSKQAVSVKVTAPNDETETIWLQSTDDRTLPNLYKIMYNPTRVGKYVFDIDGSLPVVYTVTRLPSAQTLTAQSEPLQSSNGFSIMSDISGPHKIIFHYILDRKEKTKSVQMDGPGMARLDVPGALLQTVTALMPDGKTQELWKSQ